MRIPVIEDERKTLAYLQEGLTESGFMVDVASRGDDGSELALERDYDPVILDVMLPEREGWPVLAEIRRAGKQTPDCPRCSVRSGQGSEMAYSNTFEI